MLLTHATLLRRVWGHGYETQTEYTRVYMARLRAKLEDPDGPPLFITEPGPGYRFTPADPHRYPVLRVSFTPTAPTFAFCSRSPSYGRAERRS